MANSTGDTIGICRKALDECPPGHLDRPTSLMSLANALTTFYDQSGSVDILNEAIAHYHECVDLHPPGDSNRPRTLYNLSNALQMRYEHMGSKEDLEESIACTRESLILCPPGHPRRSAHLDNFANGHIMRYQNSGLAEDLDLAISSHREALGLRPPGNPDRDLSLNNLAYSLQTRYDQVGRMEDLNEAVSYYHELLELLSSDHPTYRDCINNFANALHCRYVSSGGPQDLADSITYYEKVLSITPPENPRRYAALNNLCDSLKTRYDQMGDINDIEKAISYGREALSITLPSNPHRANFLSTLSDALQALYNYTGRVEEVEDAISYRREVLSLRPVGHPNHPSSLTDFAAALQSRYHHLENLSDIEEAIICLQESLSFCPTGNPHRFYSLENLANALMVRYERLGREDDIDNSVAYHREAIELCPSGNPIHPISLTNLACALHTRYDNRRRLEDLSEAIQLHRESLSILPPAHPNRALMLTNFADALFSYYKEIGESKDIEESISTHRSVLNDLRPPGHPDRSRSLRSLANALLSRFEKNQKSKDFQEAFKLYEDATSDGTSIPSHRLTAAIFWMNEARTREHKSLLTACKACLQLVHRCLISHGNVESQQRFLATANVPRSLASDAASAAIAAGDLELAVELLEQGRAILWSKVDAYKYPLEQLRQVEQGGELADRLEILGSQLEHLVLLSRKWTNAGAGSTTEWFLDNQARSHRILSEEWEEVITAIRKIDGFENFLQAAPFRTLQLAAENGPVILINVSKYRCDAIIIVRNGPPVLVPLAHIQTKDLLAHIVDKSPFSRVIVPLLRDIWSGIVSPIVDSLRALGIPLMARIWWCPTSDLSALPIHAAGAYIPGKRNLPDIYTCSYTSTLSALIKSRANISKSLRIPNLLIVGQPGNDLQKVEDESENIQRYAKHANIIMGPEATRRVVLNGLKQHPWVHLACHGRLGDKGQPFRSSFELYDKPLTLLDLIRARLPNAEFAFLSACHSASGDANTRDENIHLSAAMQFCGFRSVVGTLWEMNDEDGPTISQEFYRYMFRSSERYPSCTDSAEALNHAVRAMRKAKVPIERWVMFVHIGA